MKLAEALNERKELQERMVRLQERLTANVKVQEGDKPSEDPEFLFAELSRTAEKLEVIVSRINRTNTDTVVDGRSIADMVTSRDIAIRHFNILRQVLKAAAERADRFTKTEIRVVSTINVAERQKALDEMGKRIREIDTKIQAANWTTELL